MTNGSESNVKQCTELANTIARRINDQIETIVDFAGPIDTTKNARRKTYLMGYMRGLEFALQLVNDELERLGANPAPSNTNVVPDMEPGEIDGVTSLMNQ